MAKATANTSASRAATAALSGDLAGAADLIDRGLRRAGPSSHGDAQLWECRGDVALFRGDLTAALAAYEAARRLAQAEGDEAEVAVNLVSEALTLHYRGDDAAAGERSRLALAAALRSGNPSAMAMAHYAGGELRHETDPEAARRLLDRSLELAEGVDARFVFGIAGLSAATMNARTARALELYALLVDHWLRAGVWTQQWTTLRTLVALLAEVGEAGTGATLLAAIEAATTAAPVYGADARRLDEATGHLRRVLGEATFETERRRGAQLGDESAVALAARTLRRMAAEAGTATTPVATP